MKRSIKSILLLIILFGMTTVISAQTVNKNAWMLGGTMGFNSIKTEGNDTSEIWLNVSPNVGYYITNDLAIGARFSLFTYSYGGSVNYQFGVGPWARYYFINSLFAQAGMDFGSAAFDFFSFNADGGSTTIHMGIGYSWFLNNSVAIEPSLQYSIYNAGEDGLQADYTRFGFNMGVQAFIGRN
jgi:outer membrane protein